MESFGCGITRGLSNLSMKKIVFGVPPFLLYHRSGFHSPTAVMESLELTPWNDFFACILPAQIRLCRSRRRPLRAGATGFDARSAGTCFAGLLSGLVRWVFLLAVTRTSQAGFQLGLLFFLAPCSDRGPFSFPTSWLYTSSFPW